MSNIREYQFHVSGFIHGIPGMWPAGSIVTVDEDAKEIVSVWPEHQEASKSPTGQEEESEPVEQEATPEVPPALEQPTEQEALAQQ